MNFFGYVVLSILALFLLSAGLLAFVLIYLKATASGLNKRISKKRGRRAHPSKITLYEFQDYSYKIGVNPKTWHTLGNARDVEDFITFRQMSHIIRPLYSWPGKSGKPIYVGVYGKRQCSRFRRVLRERGAEVLVLKERPPLGTPKQLVFTPYGAK